MPRHRLLNVQAGDQYCIGGWECVDSDGEDERRHTRMVGDGELQLQIYMILVNCIE